MKHYPRNIDIKEIKKLLADYMYSEGCSCCQNIDEHDEAKAALGKLLHIPKYPDSSGYDFYRFRSKKK